MLRVIPHVVAVLVALSACTQSVTDGPVDLGELPELGKGDAAIVHEIPFAVGPSVDGVPGEVHIATVRTWGRLAVTTDQDRDLSWERLQIVAETDDGYRRRSWRGRSPYVTVAPRGDGATRFHLTLLNWGDAPGFGTLRVETEASPEAGIDVVYNAPDCDGCDKPEGRLRDRIIEVIQSAEETLDIAIYGLDDPAIIDAICNAAEDGVAVRAFTDETSEDPENSRSYYPSFFAATGLAGCGAEVTAVRSYGLMHHKLIVADRDSELPTVLTGSTNMTMAGLTRNHNHIIVVRGLPGLAEAYAQELAQFERHCATDRLDGRSCDECTPACTENRSAEGPFFLPGGRSIEVYFSPGDDAMRALRGEVRTIRGESPDPECAEDDADCICRRSGSRWACEYCAQGDDGWGLIGEAEDRLWMTMYSATDGCFALGLRRAAERGVSVRTIWDYVKAGSKYSRDDYLCASGVETWISQWGGGDAQIRNHNKVVVVDDAVFTGSMNLSDSGASENNENSLLVRDRVTADGFAYYIDTEIDLLRSMGVTVREPVECLCSDLVDNDGDGIADGEDVDCDGAY